LLFALRHVLCGLAFGLLFFSDHLPPRIGLILLAWFSVCIAPGSDQIDICASMAGNEKKRVAEEFTGIHSGWVKLSETRKDRKASKKTAGCENCYVGHSVSPLGDPITR
jgi:hypothetical protein